MQVTVIEATEPTSSKDSRGIALNYGSVEFLKTLEIWGLLAANAVPIKKVHISSKNHFSKIRFDAAEEKLDALGYVIEGGLLLNALEKKVQSTPTISFIRPATIHTVKKEKDHYRVQYDHHELLVDFLVVADGQNSQLRNMLGVEAHSTDQQQSALLSNVTLSLPHQHTAFERFTKEGVIAMLPLSKTTYKMVITADNKKIEEWKSLHDQQFLEKLQENFGDFLGNFTQLSTRYMYPLTTLYTDQQVLEHAIILGNAAHTLSPVAAQGLNLGIQDIIGLFELFLAEKNLLLPDILKKYSTEAQKRQKPIMKLTKLIADLKPGCVQQLSFLSFTLIPSLKNFVGKKMLGV
jgi:2-octaprenyl-6-methoxyphenol hydroxylase